MPLVCNVWGSVECLTMVSYCGIHINKLYQNNWNLRELVFEVNSRSQYPREVSPPCLPSYLRGMLRARLNSDMGNKGTQEKAILELASLFIIV